MGRRRFFGDKSGEDRKTEVTYTFTASSEPATHPLKTSDHSSRWRKCQKYNASRRANDIAQTDLIKEAKDRESELAFQHRF